MAAKLIVAPEAAMDIDEAYGWYECQRTEYAGGAVTVYCVFHTARDPAKWRQRLP